MASKGRSIFIKAVGVLLHGGYEKTFCLCILLVKQICSDSFLLSLSTPLAIYPVKPSHGGEIYWCHLQYMSVHAAVSLGNKITISLSSLPYVILKSKQVAKKKHPQQLLFSALKALGQSLE